MSHIKTNIIRGDARERTKNLENMTLMGNINSNLEIKNNFKSNITNFENKKLKTTNNHETLLKLTKGFYNLESCCLLNKNRALSLEDGLHTNINVDNTPIVANSLFNKAPLYGINNCEFHTIPNMKLNIKKDNFNYPIPITKNNCCSEDKPQPKPFFNW